MSLRPTLQKQSWHPECELGMRYPKQVYGKILKPSKTRLDRLLNANWYHYCTQEQALGSI